MSKLMLSMLRARLPGAKQGVELAHQPGKVTLNVISKNTPSSTVTLAAREQMKQYWKKNLKLNRPNSPWTIYHWHLPMCTSLFHRVTGVVMGCALYGLSLIYVAGHLINFTEFNQYIEKVKSWNVPKPILFTFKVIMAFPLVYHSVNGLRHLQWDEGRGLLLKTQYKSGSLILSASVLIAVLLASKAYIIKN